MAISTAMPKPLALFGGLVGFIIFLSVTFFTSVVDLALGRAGVMPMQPTFLALVLLAIIAVIVFLQAAARPALWSALSKALVASTPQFVCYVIVAAVALLGAALPGAYWIDNGKWILLIPYGFLIWFCTLVIASNPNYRKWAHAGLVGGFILLCGSVIYEIFFPATFSNLNERASGFAGNSNFGALCTCMLCATVLHYGRGGRRVADLVLLGMTAIAVLATQSRSGMAEYAILLMFWIWSCLTDKNFSVREALRLMLLVLITLVVMTVLFSLVLKGSLLFSGEGNRIARILSGKTVDDGSGDERVGAALNALRLVSEAPILGHGTGHTRTMPVLPHNQYLQQWVNNGLVGLLAYICMLLSGLFSFGRSRYLAGAAFISIVIVGSVFSHNILDQRTFIMSFAILIVSCAADKAERAEKEKLAFS